MLQHFMGKLCGEEGWHSFYKVFSLLEYGVVLKRTLDMIVMLDDYFLVITLLHCFLGVFLGDSSFTSFFMASY